ncbi:MAG: methyl-accepting chemotaxis protein [Oleispira sp.]|jgi:methyl-accepting chemotaxis protein
MKSSSLRIKLMAASLIMLLAMALVLSINVNRALNNSGVILSERTQADLKAAVYDQLKAESTGYGNKVASYINSAYQVPIAMKSIIEASINSAQNPLSRSQISLLIQAQLAANTNISSMYTQFEANGYDNNDLAYQDSSADYNALNTGSLEVYWVRDRQKKLVQFRIENSQEKYATTLNEFGTREAEWYLCAKDNKKPCAMEPYMYEIEEGYSELMTSLTAPILINNQFQGVVGVDVNLPNFQTLTEELSQSLFSGAAKVTLLSETGLIVGSSHYFEKTARPFKEALPKYADVYRQLTDENNILETEANFVINKSIDIVASGNQWHFIIELPKKIALARASALVSELEDSFTSINTQQIVLALIVTLIATFIMTLIIKSIVQPLYELRNRIDNLASADGDLTQQLKLNTHAELIALSGGFNLFLQKLRDMINELKNVSHEVRDSSATSEQISRDTNQQTSQQQLEISSVVTATNEMSATSHEVARLAQSTADGAKKSQDIIKKSQAALSIAVDGVRNLANDMGDASQSISQVAARSEDITRIIDVIKAIAEQTNLLALNAAIEAARAGEQGRGFAVVADEVRSLASKTQNSTDEINSMIQSLQLEVSKAVTIIDNSTTKAEESVEQTHQAFTSLSEVVETTDTINDNADQVAAAAEEQSQVAEEINKNLTIIGDAADTLAQLSEQSQQSNQHLIIQVDSLDKQLGKLHT